jgi:hypothetical protein
MTVGRVTPSVDAASLSESRFDCSIPVPTCGGIWSVGLCRHSTLGWSSLFRSDYLCH